MLPQWLSLSRALIIVNYEVHIKTNSRSDAITPTLVLPLATDRLPVCVCGESDVAFECEANERIDTDSAKERE